MRKLLVCCLSWVLCSAAFADEPKPGHPAVKFVLNEKGVWSLCSIMANMMMMPDEVDWSPVRKCLDTEPGTDSVTFEQAKASLAGNTTGLARLDEFVATLAACEGRLRDPTGMSRLTMKTAISDCKSKLEYAATMVRLAVEH